MKKLQGSILQANGILYVTAPDNVWALDTHNGREIWHYVWKTRGGTHIGNRGAGIWNNHLFFVTPDDYLISLNATTGEERWSKEIVSFQQQYFLTTAPTVVVDGEINGRTRKLVLTAARNGYYFTIDRVTGEHIVTSKFSTAANWAKGLNAKGQPVRDPAKDHHIAGALISAANLGAANWPPPAFSPDTGLFYVNAAEMYAMYYLSETDPRGAMGLGGKEERAVATEGSYLTAIDYKTGKTVWRHKYRTMSNTGLGSGLLTTAGRLLFGGDVSGNLVAFDPANGNILWHSAIGQVSNAPQTYMVDGRQYVLAAAGDTLYAFTLY